MSKPIAVALIAAALAATLAPLSAQAFDILALRKLGFSPDGRYFAFMQYGPQWEASKLFAETAVIDTSTDRFVPGAPARRSIDMKDDADSDNIGPELKAFLAGTDKRNAALLGKHKIGKPGVALVRVPEARVEDYEHTTDKPPPGPGEATVKAKHPQLGDFTLTLDVREADWPKTSRLYAGKEAPSCAEEVDYAKGAIFRLTLERNGRTIVLQDDKSIPASRHCVSSYGISEVQTFDRPDGKVTLAVLLGMKRRGHEGEDRVFLAVTRVLER